MDAIKFVNEQLNQTTEKSDHPKFRAGDNIVVSYKIVEGDKERVQDFRGDVLQLSGQGGSRTLTVRKISNGVGVERIFPLYSPNIVGIKILKRGRVRRAKLYYLRKLVGKKARIREKSIYNK
jgi:large subunit ribosomal protein L19